MLLFLVFCLINLVVAQVPKLCTSPPQWEARIRSTNERQQSTVDARWSYDAVYKRIRVLQDIRFAGGNINSDVLRLFDSQLEFTLDLTTNICTRKPIERPWRDFGPLSDAESLGEAYIGSSGIAGGGIRVTLWTGNETFSDNRTVTYEQSWTYEGCLPVFTNSIDPKNGNTHSAYYDTTIGITNPNIFIPPQQCLTDEEYRLRDVLFGTAIDRKIK